MDRLSILHAPSPLGLEPPTPGRVPGVRRMPDALRTAGLHAMLDAEHAGEVEPPAYDPARDPDAGVRNARAIADYSVRLADRVAALLESGRRPLVLGGDCSILLGCMLALRRRGRFGLAFIDAHPDMLGPETSGTGGAAGMDLAIATGRGPEPLADLEGRAPLVADPHAVAIGCRDALVMADHEPPRLPGSSIRVHSRGAIRSRGVRAVVDETLARLGDAGVEGFWIHLDADVLDPGVMPAVDSPEPDGLTYAELVALVRGLVRSPLALGMEVTIYDPDRDPTGEIARAFAHALAAGLDPAQKRTWRPTPAGD
ncbi:MAG: arginase family protein [Gemmatimonadota bacterium]